MYDAKPVAPVERQEHLVRATPHELGWHPAWEFGPQESVDVHIHALEDNVECGRLFLVAQHHAEALADVLTTTEPLELQCRVSIPEPLG
jgi:hypothetical protein